MADFPALPLWTDAYLSDTRHLSTLEHGAYLLLLMEAWRRPSRSLPDEDGLLARLTGLSQDDWQAVKPIIFAMWHYDGRKKDWRQKRLSKEADYVAQKSRSQRDKIAKRWNKTKKDDTAVLPEAIPDRYPDDTPTPTPTPTPFKERKNHQEPVPEAARAATIPTAIADLTAAVLTTLGLPFDRATGPPEIHSATIRDLLASGCTDANVRQAATDWAAKGAGGVRSLRGLRGWVDGARRTKTGPPPEDEFLTKPEKLRRLLAQPDQRDGIRNHIKSWMAARGKYDDGLDHFRWHVLVLGPAPGHPNSYLSPDEWRCLGWTQPAAPQTSETEYGA